MRASAYLACVIACGLAHSPGAAAMEVISPGADQVSVTIYRDLFALVTETRTVDLPEGPVTLSFDGVVETLLPASSVVTDTGRALVERNFDYDPLTPDSLLRRSIGSEVLLTRTHRRTGKVVQTPAVVVSANQRGVVLRTRDGNEALYCSGLPEQLTFQNIPDGLRQKPRLSVQLGAGPAGRRTVRLSYLAQGFSWKSDYVARLAPGGDRADLKGWLTLRNFTNTSFRQASVQVVAGRLNLLDVDDGGTSTLGPSADYGNEADLREAREERLQELADEQQEEAEDYDGWPTLLYGCFSRPAPVSAVAKAVIPPKYALVSNHEELESIVVTGVRAADIAEREQLADYQLYRLPWPTDLAARQTKQALFLDRREVKVDRYYELNIDAIEDPTDEALSPSLRLAFENRKSDGLGEPLPEGVLRLYESGPGSDLFAGEGVVNDTSVAERVEVTLAQALDLRVDGDVETDEHRALLGGGTIYIARVQLRIHNAKALPVRIEIHQPSENFPAGLRITRSSHRTLREFGEFVWRLIVPAHATEPLSYQLRYREDE